LRAADGILFDRDFATLLKFPGGKTGSYVVPDTAKTIATHAFSGSTHLTAVQMGDKVTSIEDDAFTACVSL